MKKVCIGKVFALEVKKDFLLVSIDFKFPLADIEFWKKKLKNNVYFSDKSFIQD